MKNSLLLVFVLTNMCFINAQVIFTGIEPASIQGNYDLSYATAGDGWGVSDLEDPANLVQDTLVQFFDATAADSLGCSAAANAADVQDQIAILFRGDCEFGVKALNAQNAGAVACVIINNTPGALIGMLGGTEGPNVTIPVVMITLSDGQTLLNEMQSGDVEVLIGNKSGLFGNDIGSNDGAVLRSKSAAIPSIIAQDNNEFEVEMGAMIYNYGFNDQADVTLTATIDFDGNQVYNETSNQVAINSGDSSFVTLPTFSQTSYGIGKYEVIYTFQSGATDEYSYDNSFTADFEITDSLFSYAGVVDSSGLPNQSGGFQPNDFSTSYSACIVFDNENASRVAPYSLIFSAAKGADAQFPSIEGEQLLTFAYEWNDNFTDLNDGNLAFSNLNQVAAGEYIFFEDKQNEPVEAFFEEPVALQDNQRYLFCVQTYNPNVFLGFDSNMDYTRNVNTYLQPQYPVEADGQYAALGFGEDAVPGIGVKFIDAAFVEIQEEQLSIDMNAYPSPVSEVLNINFKGYDVDRLELVNLTGQVVAAQTVQTGAKSTKVDVNNLENGVYIVNVYLTNGMTETMQVVVNH